MAPADSMADAATHLLNLPVEVLDLIIAFCIPDRIENITSTCRWLNQTGRFHLATHRRLKQRYQNVVTLPCLVRDPSCFLPIQLLSHLLNQPYLAYYIRSIECYDRLTWEGSESLEMIDDWAHPHHDQLREHRDHVWKIYQDCRKSIMPPGASKPIDLASALIGLWKKEEMEDCSVLPFHFDDRTVHIWLFMILTQLRAIKTNDTCVDAGSFEGALSQLRRYNGPYGPMLQHLHSVEVLLGKGSLRNFGQSDSPKMMDIFLQFANVKKFTCNGIMTEERFFDAEWEPSFRASSIEEMELYLSPLPLDGTLMSLPLMKNLRKFSYHHDWRSCPVDVEHSNRPCCWEGKRLIQGLTKHVGDCLEHLSLSYRAPTLIHDGDLRMPLPLLDMRGLHKLRTLEILNDVFSAGSNTSANRPNVGKTEVVLRVPRLMDVLPASIETLHLDAPQRPEVALAQVLQDLAQTICNLPCLTLLSFGGCPPPVLEQFPELAQVSSDLRVQAQEAFLGERLARDWSRHGDRYQRVPIFLEPST